MFNLLWGAVFVLVNFMFFLLCYRLFGKKGLYAWIGVATVLANIQVTKTIDLLGITTTLGNTMYVSMYMASDLLNEKYGPKEARKAVWFGFFTLIMTTITMQMVLLFQPTATDFAQAPMQQLFGLLPRLALASLTAYAVSQLLDVRLYAWIRKFFPKRHQLWIRGNGSTMISSFIDTLLFCSIAFYGYAWGIWLELLFTTYILKFVLTAAGTPILYIARNFRFIEEEGQTLKP
ncbi:queuosine precursor transporter [Paenibacillus sp. BJ-4]|uniref:queuosine precursor transporter n=1 Tax=Paenibacillus sp. BJ-4 TaxID=2878097 RepID=UPI001CF0AE53|nr:queuosine precursor transporter [Paenibacillus sp. BJ-4]